MTILWRYQIREFLQRLLFILVFTTLAMLTLKAGSFAKFFSIGMPVKTLLFFILLQIPLLLPMAIAISSLLATCLVVHKLYNTNAIATLRTSGLRINAILAPLFFMGLVASCCNFLLLTDLIPLSRMTSCNLLYDEKQIHPLVALKKGKAPFLKRAFIHMDLDRSSNFAENLFVLIQNPHTHHLNLFRAKTLSYDGTVHIHDSSLIAVLEEENPQLPTILLENVSYQELPLAFFTPSPSLYYSTKSYGVLTMKELISLFRTSGGPHFISDFFVRVSLCLLPFALTFMGAIFSLRSLETRKYLNRSCLVVSTASCLMGVLIARTFRVNPEVAIMASLAPPLLFISSAICYKRLLEAGRI